MKRSLRIASLVTLPIAAAFFCCDGAHSAPSPAELLNLKTGPLNQCKPFDIAGLVDQLAQWHGQYVKGEKITLPRITVSTPSASYSGFLLHEGAGNSGDKTVVMAVVPANERFPTPSVAYIRVSSIQSIVFEDGGEASTLMK